MILQRLFSTRGVRAAIVAGIVGTAAPVLTAQAPPPAGTPVERHASSPLSRDADGQVFIRAIRVTGGIRIDGQLNEPVYTQTPPITEFVQSEPEYGKPISERTEAWVFYDDENIYFACRCWDSHPEKIVANDMRRDSSQIQQQDSFAVSIDTFHDGRTGVLFYVTAVGAIKDSAHAGQRVNPDWDPVWNGKATRFDRGWISEMAFPFKSLRYGSGREQTWGIQLRRIIRSKNEMAHLTPVNPQFGPTGINQHVGAPTLVGLQAPPGSRNIEVKPYAISRVTTDLLRQPPVRNKSDSDVGLDVKAAVTRGLTADFTYNTDFAQVESDEAQVNLTRFNLLLPEKRAFFLEGQSLFQFGAGASFGSDDAPSIFYSRRIGIGSGGRAVPVRMGGRINGKAGPWSLGALSITTSDDAVSASPETNFSVVRMQHDLLAKSAIGGILTRRSVSASGPGANTVWGLDTNLAFHKNVFVNAYLAQSDTQGRHGDDMSYEGQLAYTADRYGLVLDRVVVEKNFNPEIGFVRRQNFRRSFGQARFSPRTVRNPIIRRYSYQGSYEYTTDTDNRPETREAIADFRIDFHSADSVSAQHSRTYEFLPAAFEIARGVVLPVGGYNFHNSRVTYSLAGSRRLTGSTSFDIGTFYGGEKKTATVRGRMGFTPRLGFEPNVSLNWVDLPQGRFRDTVAGGRSFFSISPRSFVAALVQYSSSASSLSTNLRLRWEYRPGSELFVVYTEGRSTFPTHGTEFQSRGFVVKINRLFRP